MKRDDDIAVIVRGAFQLHLLQLHLPKCIFGANGRAEIALRQQSKSKMLQGTAPSRQTDETWTINGGLFRHTVTGACYRSMKGRGVFWPESRPPQKPPWREEIRTLADHDAPIALELKGLKDIEALNEALSERLKATGVSDSDRRRFLIALEEIVVNAIVHAHAAVSVTADAAGRLISATVRYGGEPFDVAAAAQAAKVGPGNRPGGYGLYIAYRYVDSIRHGHTDGQNVVTLERKVDGRPGGKQI